MNNSLVSAKKLISSKNYYEAISVLDDIILSSNECLDAYRLRASAFAMAGDYAKALEDRAHVISNLNCELKDLYLGAQNAVFGKKFDMAIFWLGDLLTQSDSNDWFVSSAYMLLAYSHAAIGEYEKAENFLDLAEEKEEGIEFYLPDVGMCTTAMLRKIFMRQR